MKNRSLWASSLFWGLVLVLTAVVLILDGLGVTLGAGIGLWQVAVGLILVALIVERLIRRKISQIFFPLAFLFLLFEGPLAAALGKGKDLISNWTVLLAALLLTIGCEIILPRWKGQAMLQGTPGNSSLYFDAANLGNARVFNKLGKTNVYFTNPEAYAGDGVVLVEENLGQVIIHLPRQWNVVTTGGENLGRVHIPPQTQLGEKSITLSISRNLGNIEVLFH